MNLFNYLDFETVSTCNRTCPTCIRNSHPDREAVKSWFEPHLLPVEIIQEALNQCIRLNFKGEVCLSHYNEPLMDKRLPEIAQLVKSYGYYVFLNTNGDYITEELAGKLDGILDMMIISLYMDEPIKSQRAEWIKNLFHKTELRIKIQSEHMATHFSPKFNVQKMAEKRIDDPCSQPTIRVIINHRQQYLLCCDDVIGNFYLGTFPEIGIETFWFGETHSKIMEDLMKNGGRRKYSYCSTCPR